MLNESKTIYDILANERNYIHFIYNTNKINWACIFEGNKGNLSLGISETGYWILKNANNFRIIENKKMFLYATPILEFPYEYIKTKIEARFENIMKHEGISLTEIFPFYQMVEFALSNLIDDYWFDLAMQWYDNFELAMQFKLINALEIITKTKKISQKNRQRARNEINKFRKFEKETPLSV